MEKNYIDILQQSLQKKIQVLQEIYRLSLDQMELLRNPELTPEEFEQNIEEKSQCIETLQRLDEGFDELYQRVQMELHSNKEAYRNEILAMKQCIRDITNLSMDIQTTEARNKELATQKFAAIKQQVKQVRSSKNILSEYHRNMTQTNYIDPQFMDNKQ